MAGPKGVRARESSPDYLGRRGMSPTDSRYVRHSRQTCCWRWPAARPSSRKDEHPLLAGALPSIDWWWMSYPRPHRLHDAGPFQQGVAVEEDVEGVDEEKAGRLVR